MGMQGDRHRMGKEKDTKKKTEGGVQRLSSGEKTKNVFQRDRIRYTLEIFQFSWEHDLHRFMKKKQRKRDER